MAALTSSLGTKIQLSLADRNGHGSSSSSSSSSSGSKNQQQIQNVCTAVFSFLDSLSTKSISTKTKERIDE
jgi:hypothetical protein